MGSLFSLEIRGFWEVNYMQNRKPESLVSGRGETGIAYIPWALKNCFKSEI